MNLESPYVRVTLDRGKQERQEEKYLSNPVGSSSAAGVKPHFSGTGVEVVGLAVLWSLRKQGPAGVDLVSNVNRRWTGVNVWPW